MQGFVTVCHATGSLRLSRDVYAIRYLGPRRVWPEEPQQIEGCDDPNQAVPLNAFIHYQNSMNVILA